MESLGLNLVSLRMLEVGIPPENERLQLAFGLVGIQPERGRHSARSAFPAASHANV